MALKGRANRRNSSAMKARHRTAQRLWRQVRPHFVVELSKSGPQLPALVGGVQRGVIESWLRPAGASPPRAGGLLKVLRARNIDSSLFRTYLEFVGPGRAIVHAVCPEGKHAWTTSSSILNRAQRRLEARGEKPLRRRADGLLEWTCARHARAAVGRNNLLLKINLPGRKRGRDKKQRSRSEKTQRHRQRIAWSRLSGASLSKQFSLCPLCGLLRYDRQWHQVCWLTWHQYRRHHQLSRDLMPPPHHQRGPSPGRRMARNYALLIQSAQSRHWPRKLPTKHFAVRVAAVSRAGRPRKFRSRAAKREAAKAFLRSAPGTWSLVFSRSEDRRNKLREALLPFPATLWTVLRQGARDGLVKKLHSFGMHADKIARVTGLDAETVRSAVEP